MPSPADNIISIECNPNCHLNRLQYSVLSVKVKVRQRQLGGSGPFGVFIRTNLNQAQRIRQQIIDRVERSQSYSTDYYDIPARYDPEADEYVFDVLLSEVGYFEFKARVESSQRDKPWVKWADGSNVGISVTPLEYGRNNSIYCAFIRQFGSNKEQASLKDENLEKTIQDLEEKGAYVLPPGGNFQSFMRELPFIIQKMGMKIIHLLPINPVPTAYGRMGMYGSPYATTDYFGIDHTYGTFSRYKTIEDQFIDLTSTIHGLGAKVFLDMVINHTGWASSILFTHRKWITVGEDRKIISPGAWGVVWGDLVELDYQHQDLWQYMAKVFLVWCQRGIDGFRLDAGYMVPLEVWQYIISKVRQEFPNTLFLLEGLGGPWETTEQLLTEGQMNWAYSELFQNYSRQQIVDYLHYAQNVSAGKGPLVHYAETHDNDRLAKSGKDYTRMRLYLSAFTSFSGAWGFTNGVEWLATEKIDVHRNTGLNWGHEDNLVEEITQINKILAENPAFWERDNLEIIDAGHEEVLAFVRSNSDHSNVIAAAINLNAGQSREFALDFSRNSLSAMTGPGTLMHNLLTDGKETLSWEKRIESQLSPGGCVLYQITSPAESTQPKIPAIFDVDADKIALLYRILLSRFESYEVGQIDQEKLLRQVDDFRKFIVLVNSLTLEYLIREDLDEVLRLVEADQVERYSALWTFRESSKEFIISGDKWLVVHTFVPCTAYLKTAAATLSMESIPSPDGLGHLSFFPPQPENQYSMLKFYWKIQRGQMIQRQWQEEEYPILSVPSGRKAPRSRKIYPLFLDKSQLNTENPTVLLSNGIGGLCQTHARPDKDDTKYNSLLSITPDPACPAHRISLVKTTRETVRIGQKYFDLDESFLVGFTRFPQPKWEFVYDDGQFYVNLERSLVMPYRENTVFIRYKIKDANTPVTLISKCFLEYRDLHLPHKFSDELDVLYLESCNSLTGRTGIEFTPAPDLTLKIVAKAGEYINQPHWIRDLDYPVDAERQLDSKGDVFAPGIFSINLHKGESQVLVITARPEKIESLSAHRASTCENRRIKNLLSAIPDPAAARDPVVKILTIAMDQFLHYTGTSWTVIAGYPWLGSATREALHCVGGLLAIGKDEVVRDLVLQASQTEENGLLTDELYSGNPMRIGLEASLRLFIAAQNYVQHTGDESFWDQSTGQGRSLRDVLASIYRNLRNPFDEYAPRMDDASGLLYSPAGATWMNTTHPQATPRAGYPVEIQALWYQVLSVLPEACPSYAVEARQLLELFQEKFFSLFWNPQRNYLMDVLASEEFQPAARAMQDTTLRFNQLLAINAQLVPREHSRQVVDIINRRLLIPAGVRSLSEDPLATPLPITDDQGILLADPRMPYQGQCVGTEMRRRLAYHNGTAWPGAYPAFIEARVAAFQISDLAVKQALAFFEPVWSDLFTAGIGTISEMKDGNYPHRPRGCFAYAPGVAETLRVYLKLKYQRNHHTHTQRKSERVLTK